MVGLRIKYFTAWKLGMFAVHTSGISYSKQNNDFNGVNHCNVMVVETSPHIREKVSNWNMMVQ